MELETNDNDTTGDPKNPANLEYTDPSHCLTIPTSANLKDFEAEHAVVVCQHFPSLVPLKCRHDAPPMNTACITTQTIQAVVRKLDIIRPRHPSLSELHTTIFASPETPTLPPEVVQLALQAARPPRNHKTISALAADVKDWTHTTHFASTLTKHQLDIL